MTPHSVIFHIHSSFAGCTYEQSHALDRFLDAARGLCNSDSLISVIALIAGIGTGRFCDTTGAGMRKQLAIQE